jgi:hypothetical protein
MYSQDTINQFIELRSQGKSLRKIADQLDICIGTAVKWDADHKEVLKNIQIDLAAAAFPRVIMGRQGPWNVDLGTPPGPEGSNGTLLRIRRGHPGFLFQFRIANSRFQPELASNPKSKI